MLTKAQDTALLFFAIFKNARARSHNAMLAPTLYRARAEDTTKTETPAVQAAPAVPATEPVPAPPVTPHFGESRDIDEIDRPSTELGATRPYGDERPYSEQTAFSGPRPYTDGGPYPWDEGPRSADKKPDFSEKKTPARDSKPYPAAYGLGAPAYHIEDTSKKADSPKMAGAVAPAAVPVVTETSHEEEVWETKEPEYVTVR
jgi:hypothetical protein